MKLVCPDCGSHKEIENCTLYAVYQCDRCWHKFRGIHAATALGDFLLKKFTIFFSNQPRFPRESACPYCAAIIDTRSNPSYCWSCAKELPISPAQPDDPIGVS